MLAHLREARRARAAYAPPTRKATMMRAMLSSSRDALPPGPAAIFAAYLQAMSHLFRLTTSKIRRRRAISTHWRQLIIARKRPIDIILFDYALDDAGSAHALARHYDDSILRRCQLFHACHAPPPRHGLLGFPSSIRALPLLFISTI